MNINHTFGSTGSFTWFCDLFNHSHRDFDVFPLCVGQNKFIVIDPNKIIANPNKIQISKAANIKMRRSLKVQGTNSPDGFLPQNAFAELTKTVAEIKKNVDFIDRTILAENLFDTENVRKTYRH